MTTITLDSILTEEDRLPPRIIFYSPEGVGKTTWAAAAPNPIFLQTEKGHGKLKLQRWEIASYNDVIEAISILLKQKHGYQTVVLDTLSRLEQMIHADIRAKHGDDIFANFGRGHKMVPPYFERLIKGLNMLQESGLMVLVLGHAEIKRFEPPGLSPYDVYLLNVHEKIRDMMFQWCDACLFANYKVYTTEQEGKFNQTRTIGVGGDKRFMYTEERPTHKAKNRYELPYEFELKKPFQWDKFLEAMGRPSPWGKSAFGVSESIEAVVEV